MALKGSFLEIGGALGRNGSDSLASFVSKRLSFFGKIVTIE